jgi:hypothetical protein
MLLGVGSIIYHSRRCYGRAWGAGLQVPTWQCRLRTSDKSGVWRQEGGQNGQGPPTMVLKMLFSEMMRDSRLVRGAAASTHRRAACRAMASCGTETPCTGGTRRRSLARTQARCGS